MDKVFCEEYQPVLTIIKQADGTRSLLYPLCASTITFLRVISSHWFLDYEERVMRRVTYFVGFFS